jgi:phosphoribosyl 1,2-cyclic phosphate phosphodiesterase
MELIFLGTGTSQGVPMIACDCRVCLSEDPRNRRSRTSAHVRLGSTSIQIDAGPEFRAQCLGNGIRALDVFILTHGHADHICGMDDLRRFCDLRGGTALPVYTTGEGADRVRAMFPYADGEIPRAGGYPAFRILPMPEVLEVPGGRIRSTLLPHGSINVIGLVFEEDATGAKLTYYTDCKEVTPQAERLARGSQVVVLDGLRPDPHPTHLHIEAAIEAGRRIGSPRTLLTHLTHAIEHETYSRSLPAGFELAYDGLRVRLG